MPLRSVPVECAQMTDIEQETQLIAYVCDDWTEDECRRFAIFLAELREHRP
jgi:hypothetical protein